MVQGMESFQTPAAPEAPTEECRNFSALWAKAVMRESNPLPPISKIRDGLGFHSTSLPSLFESRMRLFAEEEAEKASRANGAWGRNGTNRTNGINGSSLLSRRTPALDLPDEEELLDGIAGNYEFGGGDYDYLGEFEEADVFNSIGGMEMEPQDGAGGGYANGYSLPDLLHRPVNGDYPHPSRTLFVRNISSTVEDSELRALFEQYGDIRTLFTKTKHRGFIMVSYYDIRHARAAMRALQRYPFKRRRLNIHFSLPKENPSEKDVNQGTLVIFNLDASVSLDELRTIFGAYGEVKEIRETPHKRHHKFIEFYDVRAAEAALRALNRTEIAGKRIKLEPSRPGGARRSSTNQQRQEQDWSSPPGQWNHYYHNENGAVLPGGIPVPNGGLRPDHAVFQPRYGSLPNNVSPLDPYGGSPLSGASSAVFRSEGFEDGHYQRASAEAELNGTNMNGRASPSYGSPFAWASSLSSGSPFAAGHGSVNHFMSPLGNEAAVGMNRNEHGPSSPRFEMLSPRFRSRMILPSMDGFNGFNNLARGRRPENSISQADRDFQLDLERIINGEDTRTTLMIKNIPNKYTAKMLLQAIDQQNRGTYDFLYLPIDFKNKCNVGYAFINMISPDYILMFYEAFEGRKWEKFNSEKVASLAYARIQGKEALIAHFQNSSLMHEDKRCRPMMFASDGPNAGEQEPFPIRTRMVNTNNYNYNTTTTTTNENNHNSACSSKEESGSKEERLPTDDTGAGSKVYDTFDVGSFTLSYRNSINNNNNRDSDKF